MKWVQPDNAQRVRDWLRKRVDGDGRIRSQVPEKWTPRDGPVVTVVSDGTPISERGYVTEIVRVTVHGVDAPSTRRLMADIDSVLLTPLARLGAGFSITPATGLIVVKDSKLGGWVSSVTYRVTTNRVLGGLRNGS